MKKEKVSTYYRKVKKGDLYYIDLMTVDSDKKTVSYVKEKLPDETFGMAKKCFSNYRFNHMKKSLENKNYEFTYTDGADDRVGVFQVKAALDGNVGASTTADLIKIRPYRSDYFSISRIEKECNFYLNELCSYFQFRYWCDYFCFVVQESFSYPLTAENKYQLAVVKSIEEHTLQGNNLVNPEDKKIEVRIMLDQIHLIEKKYEKKIMKMEKKANA